jgi:WD40 repeat protein
LDLKTRRLNEVKNLSKTCSGILVDPHDPLDGAFFAYSRELVLRGLRRTLQIVDTQRGKVLHTVPDVDLFTLSRDERLIALAEAERGQVKVRVTPHNNVGHKDEISYAPGASVTLLNSATGEQTLKLDVAGCDVWAMAFSPDSKILAATSGWDTGQVHVYDVASGKELHTLTTPPLRTPVLAFTPDGSNVITEMLGTSVLLWDIPKLP